MMGQLYDLTGSYDIANTVAGISLICGVVCMIVVMYLHKRHLQKSVFFK